MAISGTGPGRYLCGCDPTAKWLEYGTTRLEKGVEVCPEHGDPLYGYLSPQREQPGLGRVNDFAKKGAGSTVSVNSKGTVDHRDNRDPFVAYRELQRERAVAEGGIQ